MKSKVFISYAHKNSKQVRATAEQLSKLGLDVWLDTHQIKGGDLWSGEIARAIRQCHFYILFVSKASMKSDAVRREVDLAYTSKRKMILVRLDAAEIPAEFAYQTSGIQWIDVEDSDWLLRLLVALGRKVPSDSLSSLRNPPPDSPEEDEDKIEVQIKGNATNSIIVIGNKNNVNQGRNS